MWVLLMPVDLGQDDLRAGGQAPEFAEDPEPRGGDQGSTGEVG